MIKIDDKTKARIFAMHWGCNFVTSNSTGEINQELFKHWKDYRDIASISVMPILAITNEDAISVARITQKPYTGIEISKRRFKVIGTPVGKSDDVKYVLVESFIHHPNVMEWRPTALVQIDHDDGDVIVGVWDGFSQEFTDGFTDHYMEVTDFLRAHGYATPCAGFSVEQLVEAGIFKI